MDLESALKLVEDLTPTSPAAGIRGQAVLDEDVSSIPAADLRRPRPSFAIGVTAAGKSSGRYRIAVRLQDLAYANSARLRAVREAARHEVDVEYIGLVRAQGLRDRARPVHPGVSLAHENVTAGTLGAFVERDGAVLALSNNHVLVAANGGERGDAVLQPGPADGGESSDQVGRLADFVALDLNDVNYVDSALCALDDGIEVDAAIPGIGRVHQICPLEDAYEVRKLGRTTELTAGTIFTFNLNNLVVHYPSGSARFDGQIEVRGHDGRFSAGGDSGALVVTDEDEGRAVGLHFAGTDADPASGLSRSFANPIERVLESLSCRLVT